MAPQTTVRRESTVSLVVRFLLLIVLGVAVIASVASLYLRTRQNTFAAPILQARLLLHDRHVREVDDAALQAGAIRGMVEALNDPFSFYVEHADTTEFHKEMLGEYVGIGVSVDMIDGTMTVVSPLDGSPALKAGIRSGDQIIRIEDHDTRGMTLNDAIAILTGKPGTPVDITVNRNGEEMPFTLTRAEITTQTVKGIVRESDDSHWRYMLDLDEQIAYIRITQFNPTTSTELRSAIEDAMNEHGLIRGLILDLRSNPGGILDEAVTIADNFLDTGTILSTKGLHVTGDTLTARPGQIIPDTAPIAVLIDEQSASASEVLAGVLVESKRAIAVGQRTFGKGSVQGVYLLPDEKGEVKLTEQLYYLPSGRSVQRHDEDPLWGVDPSPGFAVPLTEEHQILMANARSQLDIIETTPDKETAPIASASASELIAARADPQLAKAYEAVVAHVTTGAWPVAGETQLSSVSTAPASAETNTQLRAAEQYRAFLVSELSRMDSEIEKLAGPVDKGPE